jgi:tetratricopeptide (TPR) repeat protein
VEAPVALESFVEIESIAAPEVLEELEEVEEIEEVEEVEELEEVEEIEEVEEVVAVEVREETEPLEELEELDELEDIVEEIEVAPVEAGSISPQQLRNDLEEAEFYLRQGLFDDAERVVHELRQRHGELSELVAKLTEIDAQRQSAAVAEESPQVFDLLSDIKDGELLGATDFLADATSEEVDGFPPAEPAEDSEDAQSHFDLGIAYKEMGLLDDAIAEFSKASKDPSRRLDCLILKGQCQVEMNDFGKAEDSFKEALEQTNAPEEVRVALQYELGLLYEATGRLPEALEKFQIVADLDLFFRDVTDKLKLLRQTLGLDEDIEAAIAPHSNRDRISFV